MIRFFQYVYNGMTTSLFNLTKGELTTIIFFRDYENYGRNNYMKFQFNVGNDLGNSEQDIYVDGKLVQQPNVFSIAGQIPWVDDDTDVVKNLKNIYDNLAVSIVATAGVPTGLYLIGKHALKTNGENVTNLYVKGNNSKANQTVPYVNTLGVIAARAVEKANEQGELPNEISVDVDMATALPVKQHTPSNIQTLQSNFLNGTHNITVHLGLTKKVLVKINFIYVHVLQEGSPAVFSLQMNSSGAWRTAGYEGNNNETTPIFLEFGNTYSIENIDGSYFDGKNILHLDCGDGTTDTPFTRGDSVDKDFGSGVNHGVGHAIDPATNDLLALAPHAFNSVSRQQYSEILKSQFTSRKHKFLNEALQAFGPHIDNQVAQIMKHVSDQTLIIGTNDIDIIVVYGGGSILMKDKLYPKLKELADRLRIQLLYVPKEYAITLNAEGLDFFVKSPIYAALKEANMNTVKGIKTNTKNSNKEVAATNE